MPVKTIDNIDETGAKGVNDQLNDAINDASVKTETKTALRSVMNKGANLPVLNTAPNTAKDDLQKFKKEVLQQPTKFTVEAIRADIHDKIFGVLAAYNNADGLNFSADVAALRPGFAPRQAGATPGAPAQTGGPAEEKTLNYDDYMKKNYPNPDDTKGYKAIFATMSYWAYRVGRWFDWSKKNPTTNANGNSNNPNQDTAQNTALDFEKATTLRGSALLNTNVRALSINTTGRIEITGTGIFVYVTTPAGEQRKYKIKQTVTTAKNVKGRPVTDFSDANTFQGLAFAASVERKQGKVLISAPLAGTKEFDEALLLRKVTEVTAAAYGPNDVTVTVPYKHTYTFGTVEQKSVDVTLSKA